MGPPSEDAALGLHGGVSSGWAVLLALVAVVGLSLANVGLDLLIADQTADRIARLIQRTDSVARDDEAAIAAIHHRGLVVDAVAGAVTLGLAIAIGLALRRSLRRQHQLLRMQIAAVGERNRELEAFAGRAAHDLRGPLTPIAGYAELLTAPGADVAALATRIHRATDRMASLIDDLLELSVAGRLPAGRGDVPAVVREVLDDLSPDLRDADVTLALADCTTACTPGILAQLVRNVVSNAIKYRGAGRRLLVQIDAAPRAARDAIEIVVTDNGVGMTGEAAARAFDPFYRASATRSVPGNGLGLAIVKRTLEAMGGDCALVSAPDQGTRVTLRLPAAPQS